MYFSGIRSYTVRLTRVTIGTISNPQPSKFGGRCVILSNIVQPAAALGAFICVSLAVQNEAAAACAGPLADFEVHEGERIREPLCGLFGDPARGRAIFAGRQGNCLACHAAPIPEEGFHGTIGPPLFDTGLHYQAAELRLRLVDSTILNPDTIMPAFHRIDGLNGVRHDRQGQPILSAQQVEDVVAWLLTLKQEPPAR